VLLDILVLQRRVKVKVEVLVFRLLLGSDGQLKSGRQVKAHLTSRRVRPH
jgi:hypothetical protein